MLLFLIIIILLLLLQSAPAPPQPSVRCAPIYKNVGQHCFSACLIQQTKSTAHSIENGLQRHCCHWPVGERVPCSLRSLRVVLTIFMGLRLILLCSSKYLRTEAEDSNSETYA
jgi:hypothetical protein